ncbi:DUF1440 domain-containing protein [Anaeromyxobacter paludicola]|uniref:DUF1440 domain-containing protein n=1 Tax=Anaeromyxobacter paludicola TaxID=2918171 RepID=A0ABN6N2Y3_9BACT|nr:DUF1440 domain-containing protein [Anaeromyxobacter paludicola]BDG07557.1 hypothetical protein AMPC_06700 [Anaeromyxobacter paludicola]
MWGRERRAGSWAGDALLGALGGLAASWVMDRVQASVLQRLGTEETRRSEREASGSGEPATYRAAEALARPFGIPLDGRRKALGAEVVHYATGAGWGALYGIAEHRLGWPTLLSGVAFGALVFALGDELIVPLLGWAGGPRRYPASVHGKALAAHLVYGASTAGAWRTLSGALHL